MTCQEEVEEGDKYRLHLVDKQCYHGRGDHGRCCHVKLRLSLIINNQPFSGLTINCKREYYLKSIRKNMLYNNKSWLYL